MQSRDSAINQVAEKNLELFECLGKARQEYEKLKDSEAKLKDSEAKLKARVFRLEQELQQNQTLTHPSDEKPWK